MLVRSLGNRLEKQRGCAAPAARVEYVGAIRLRRAALQAAGARPEAPPRLTLAQLHAQVLIVLTKTVLKVLGVEVTEADTSEVGGDVRAQALKLPAPAV